MMPERGSYGAEGERLRVLSVSCPECFAQAGVMCYSSTYGTKYYKLHARRWDSVDLEPPTRRIALRLKGKIAAYWNKYDTCPRCDALPGNACREDNDWHTRKVRKTRAHYGRPMRVIDSNT